MFKQLTHAILLYLLVLMAFVNAPAEGLIRNWQTGQVIPGTEVIKPGPYVKLNGWNTDSHNLQYADFSGGLNLTYSNFTGSWIDNAHFNQANLSSAHFSTTTLTNADLTDAVIYEADFHGETAYGFTAEQLYSTASYKNKTLTGIHLGGNDMVAWNFAGQRLSRSDFVCATLTDSNFTNANLSYAYFTNTTLDNVNFTDATIKGAVLRETVPFGFTAQQLYSTASYKKKDLSEIDFSFNNMPGWSFVGQNLKKTKFESTTLTNADFTNAIVNGAYFQIGSTRGLTKEQLYSTASYKNKDLSEIDLHGDILTEWSFAGQNLTKAKFDNATLTNADFTGADTRGAMYLTSAQLATAITTNLIRPDGTIQGLNLNGGKTLWVRDHTISPISVRIENGMDMGTDGSLKRILEADEWNSTISFASGIPVALGGTLDLTFAEGVDLSSQVGRQFKLFDWTGVSPTGAFTVLHPEQWVLDELYTTGMVTYVPEPATLGLILAGMGSWLLRRRQK